MMTEQPLAGEIDAYVDGALDNGRKFVVETYLSQNPALAARVMGDLGAASGLRLLFAAGDDTASQRSNQLQQLAAPPTPARRWRAAVIAALSTSGLAAAGLFLLVSSKPPEYVDFAVNSHRIASLRATMHSQVETPHYDAREIVSSTRIAMPSLPGNWRITDVQLFPAAGGPALVVALRTEGGQNLSLFAVRAHSNAPERPDAVREGRESVAYWRRGEMSYALTGDTDPAAIDATAEALNRTWLKG